MGNPIREFLKSRKTNPDLYPGLSLTKSQATFLLWNLSGELCGFQQYTPDAPKNTKINNASDQKYWTLLGKEGLNEPRKPTAKQSVFGLELLNPKNPILFIAEGIFDVTPLHILGANALAVLSNDPKHLKEWLRTMPYTVVALCEGGAAGRKLAKYGDYAVYLPEGQDPGDMPMEWFQDLIYQFQLGEHNEAF